MATAPDLEKLFLDGPAGRLEAILETPAEGEILGAAVICHPHPQHGGTMHNKVAHTLARSFVRLGYRALRFNFRGTEASDGSYDEGVGELDDALAAIDWLQKGSGDLPFWVAGFSFGAAISIRAAVAREIDGLVSVAPAVSRFATGLTSQPSCPWLIVQGDEDELVPVQETLDWVNGLEPGPELQIVTGAEHFFHGRLLDLREALQTFVRRQHK